MQAQALGRRWVAVDEKHGAWAPLLPAALHTGTPVDPATITPPAGPRGLAAHLVRPRRHDPLRPFPSPASPSCWCRPTPATPPSTAPSTATCRCSAPRGIPPSSSPAPPPQRSPRPSPSRAATASPRSSRAPPTCAARPACPQLRKLLDATVMPSRPGVSATADAETFTTGLAASARPDWDRWATCWYQHRPRALPDLPPVADDHRRRHRRRRHRRQREGCRHPVGRQPRRQRRHRAWPLRQPARLQPHRRQPDRPVARASGPPAPGTPCCACACTS